MHNRCLAINMEEKSREHVGAYTCVFNSDLSEILLLWRKKEEREGKVIKGWGNIGGSVEPGETALEACVREANEEIGIDLEPSALVQVGIKSSPETSLHKWTVHFYAASIDESIGIKLNDESRGYGWFGKEELPDGALDSKEDILGWWALAEKAFKNGKMRT